MWLSSVFVFLFIVFSSQVMADIKLSVSQGVSILAVNGVEIESGSVFKENNTVVLPDGKNQLLAQYSLEIKKSGSYEVESTDPHVIVFSEKNKVITLLVPEIKRLSGLRKFNKSKSWILKDSTGRSIDYLSQPLIKEGIQINRDYESELQSFNSLGGDISINTSVPSLASPVVLNTSNNKSSSINLPETLLQYWYLKADIETRKRFKSWVRNK